MLLELNPDELLTTTRSVRKRLDLTRPVPREVVLECLTIAMQAPTGSNQQGWRWMVVDDPEHRAAIAGYYGPNFDAYAAAQQAAAAGAQIDAGDARVARRDAVVSSSVYLRQHLHEVPVFVIPVIAGRVDGADSFVQASFWGSILPAAWSFMLALRARGLGSSWTTLHLPNEREVADLLGIPYDRYTQAGLFPVAYTKGTDFKPAARLDAQRLVSWNRWGRHDPTA